MIERLRVEFGIAIYQIRAEFADQDIEEITRTVSPPYGVQIIYDSAQGDDVASILDRIPEDISGLIVFKTLSETDVIWLKKFNRLELFSMRECNGRIGFSEFPLLRHYLGPWIPEISAANETVESLSVNGFKYRDSNVLKKFHHLSYLTIAKGDMSSLSFLEYLPKLKNIGVYYCSKLSDTSGLSALKKLERLELEACKKADVEVASLDGLNLLKSAIFSGISRLESIAFCDWNPSLENLTFVGTTVSSDDLEPALRSKALKHFDGKAKATFKPPISEVRRVINRRSELQNL